MRQPIAQIGAIVSTMLSKLVTECEVYADMGSSVPPRDLDRLAAAGAVLVGG